MNYSGLEELKLLDTHLKNYNEKIVNLFIQNLKINESSSVLDFGAGIGTLADIFYQKTGIKSECFEICNSCKEILLKKGYKVSQEFSAQEKYDIIYSSNVLEHIENDFETIKNLKKMLKKNGFLIIFVPAFNFLYSEFDVKIGHYRRYDKQRLNQICISNKLKINNFV